MVCVIVVCCNCDVFTVTEDSLLSWLKELPPGADANKQHVVSPALYIPGMALKLIIGVVSLIN
jgi:hypothetical protein